MENRMIRSKYGNSKCRLGNMSFDSKREMERFLYLKQAERRGIIRDVQRQVEFVLVPDEYEDVVTHLKTKDRTDRKRVWQGIRYKADFVYYDIRKEKHIVEDVKISKDLLPKEYLLKEKMMHAFKHIDIRRVYKPTEAI